MDKVKAYFVENEGYHLFMPNGDMIPIVLDVAIHDGFDKKTGSINPTASVTIFVEVVNIRPAKSALGLSAHECDVLTSGDVIKRQDEL